MVTLQAAAQKQYLLTGLITSEKGETLPYASVKAMEQGAAATADKNGYYALPLTQGKHTIAVDGTGYGLQTLEVEIDKDTRLNVGLSEVPNELGRVTVKSTRGSHLMQPVTGYEKFLLKDTRNLPAMLGERDILKTLQLLPGVKSAGDGNSGFYVRGGSADQNLVLLDGAPVYNASHFMGFFSVFNADAIKEVSLYKGSMPAQYGGRLSSVLDISTSDGDNQSWKVNGGIGLISTRLSVEGPITKDKSSFLISGRRTYVDMFLKLSKDSAINSNKMNFYDVNAKFSWSLGKNDKISVAAYSGHDLLSLSGLFNIAWGNRLGSVHWNHHFSNKLVTNTAVSYSNFNYTAGVAQTNYNINIASRIKDLSGKTEWIFTPDNRNKIYIGGSSAFRSILPGNVQSLQKSAINKTNQPIRHSVENALYVNNEWTPGDKWQISYGVRLTGFSILGGRGDFYQLNPQGHVTDTMRYGTREVVKTYINAEPRLSASFQLNPGSSVKASYSRTVQNLHLIASATASSPTDRWVASTNIIRPEIADQVSAGYYKNLGNNTWQLTTEVYYKTMQNQIDYRNGADILDNQALESKLLYGKGRAYGIETLVKKKKGKFTGWVGYTLSKTERQIDGINNNQWYNARQDRTHEVSVVTNYELGQRWSLSASWVFYTGNAVTLPAGKYIINNRVVYYYTERNGYRMPAYHRLDVSASAHIIRKKRLKADLTFGVYNAYGRENAYSLFFRQSKTTPGKTEAIQVSLFKYVPSISCDFKF
ncbi:collagen-binding protein [Filimonas zeae]|uniref:Collagen-binding protein n=2 Tax=Filimonas zeae TaxID=1737353 RepID=A0A917MW82_9BACT|nr:collagen-binding protein [Filimonas zeae]